MSAALSDRRNAPEKRCTFWPAFTCRYVTSRHPEKIVQAEVTWLRFQVSNRWLAIYRLVDVDPHGKKTKSVHLFVRMRNGEVRRLKFRLWPLFFRGHAVDTR